MRLASITDTPLLPYLHRYAVARRRTSDKAGRSESRGRSETGDTVDGYGGIERPRFEQRAAGRLDALRSVFEVNNRAGRSHRGGQSRTGAAPLVRRTTAPR